MAVEIREECSECPLNKADIEAVFLEPVKACDQALNCPLVANFYDRMIAEFAPEVDGDRLSQALNIPILI